MSVIDTLKGTAGRVAGDVQQSLRRARLEGERRVLQRQHRSTLEALGARTFDLAKGPGITVDAIAPEVAAVEAKLMEIDAKTDEIAALRARDDGAPTVDLGASERATGTAGDGP